MPYYGHIYYGYGDFLANNLYVLLLIPVLLLSLWAQFQVSGSFRRYNAVNNRRRITGAQAAEAVLRAAALTYVAALLMSLLQLMRFVLIFIGRGGRDQGGSQ